MRALGSPYTIQLVNTFDIAFLLLVGCGGLVGAFRGTAREVASLLHVIGAAGLSRLLLPQTLLLVKKLYDFQPGQSRELAAWTCGFLLFYLFLLGLLILARPFFRRLREPPGRFVGFLFGLTRTALLLPLLLPLILWAAPEVGPARQEISESTAVRAAREASLAGPAAYLVPTEFTFALPKEQGA